MKNIHKALANFYLDYFNNYLTIHKMMTDHDLTKNEIETLLVIGKRVHEDRAKLAAMTNEIRKQGHKGMTNEN